MTRASPIVRWAGGKTRLLPEVLVRVPAKFGRYHEPFAGGAAVFFALASAGRLAGGAALSDANPDLVRCYRAVAHDVEGVIAQLRPLADNHDADLYASMRQAWNDDSWPWADVERAAAFLYLNRTCFNGLWRVNRAGKFNVPIGDTLPAGICDADGIRAAARALARAEIRCAGFEESLVDAAPGDLVYLDPPYDRVADSSFTSYTANDFGPEQQRRLSTIARDLARRGCAVIASNADTPLVRELYAGFRLDVVRAPRSISARGDRRAAVGELLISSTAAARSLEVA